MSDSASTSQTAATPTLAGHLDICRFDHWFKNVFVLPGVLVAVSFEPALWQMELLWKLLLGLLSVGFVASSNYTINEVLDAPFDRLHPTKCNRPVPGGLVSIPLAYVQWFVLLGIGLALAATISMPFVYTMLTLWIMGCLYNIPPIRTKDVVYLDVTSEAINNPLRFLAGWFIAASTLPPPASMLISYWMVGCFFMGLKRFAEYRRIRQDGAWAYFGDDHLESAAAYRRSFRYYTEGRLLISTTFYGCASMLFFGAFLMRYRLELVLAFPLIAWVMAIYQGLALREDSPVQQPEGLYKEKLLITGAFICGAAIVCLLFVDIPLLHDIFQASVPPTNG
ncbi:MAG: UbiA family prenyltransferase [Planctomycetota bacterium]